MDASAPEEERPPANLRIACLEPSATSICTRLGLQPFIVGVTHECHPGDFDPTIARILTKNGLTVTSQGDIHLAVQEQVTRLAQGTCPMPSPNDTSTAATILANSVNSLYPLLEDQLEAAQPNIIFTQNLCSVCAPTEQDVLKILLQNYQTATVLALQPTTLEEVAETFVTVAQACGVPRKGLAMKQQWLADFDRIHRTVSETRSNPSHLPPSLLVLEWLDPPFDGGHWIYQMIHHACLRNAMGNKTSPKSLALSWDKIYHADPDVVLVGCCGFELERNVQDVMEHSHRFQTLRAGRQHRVFACNGNTYIVQPAPDLLLGTLIMAKCAYHDQPKVLAALDALGIEVEDKENSWQQVNVMTTNTAKATIIEGINRSNLFQPIPCNRTPADAAIPSDPSVMDMEDIIGGSSGATNKGGFSMVHEEACKNGLKTYLDPETGYQVFTAIAHKERGRCCGSGCRHCPYSHESVRDKANKIQQPSILYQARGEFLSVVPPAGSQRLKALFFSGGKDSFLTIRALARQSILDSINNKPTFGVVLMTTFDATTRTIAHQEILIEDVIRQATHLDVTLVGIPLRRGSGETYLERIRCGLNVIETQFGQPVDSLVFGDLHLGHIKEWRDSTFSEIPMHLEYPLWKVDYDVLMKDLEASQVPCVISGSSIDRVQVGTSFTRELYKRCQEEGVDGFGEQGEFHSLAKVWEVSREQALGLN